MDTADLPRFPASFAEAIRGRAPWPDDAAPDEIHAIEEHGMLPLVYRWSRIPALRAKAVRAAGLEIVQAGVLREVLAALPVSPLVTKGTALAYSLYPSPDLRPRTDVDLLIDERDLEAVRAAFTSIGFRETVSVIRQHMFYRVDPNRVMQSYDVHLDITNNATTAGVLQYAELQARAMPLPPLGAIAPSPEDALLYACVHRVVHHHDVDRWIWLYDIHLLYDAVDREVFWRRAAERRVVTICRHSIVLAREAFGGETGKLPAAVEDEPSAVFLNHDRSRAALLAGDLAALPSWRQRLGVLGTLALPPVEYMEQAFGVRSRALLPFFYLWRGLRGVTRLFRRVSGTTSRR
ncbi:MAG TPA: nucleotidyltransferase family protein [Thermoanaerobaculia bacterium]|nr:nucleotidyltransferase family protein [Thermoanaerobaculia bacterium]